MGEISILVADDHPVVHEGFRAMLTTDQTMEVVGEACDGAEAVAKVAEIKPDVVLMDIRMPNMDGIKATQRLLQEYTTSGQLSQVKITGYLADLLAVLR